MENLTTVSMSNFNSTLQMKFFVTSPNILIIIILIIGIQKMYLGIEIAHPIYVALFCNLVSHLLASIMEILIAPFLTKIRITTLVKGSFTFCILFHCCCWCVLSILRYVYIVHGDWLHYKIPENKNITIITILSIYFLYSVGCTIVFLPTVYFGWPYREVYELERGPKLICISSVLSTYFILLGLSCFFYGLMLHHRGAMTKNIIAPSQNEVEREKDKVSINLQNIKSTLEVNNVKYSDKRVETNSTLEVRSGDQIKGLMPR